jgi:hypothetical protein
MIDVTTTLLPLGKLVLQKVIRKVNEKSEQDPAGEETRRSLSLGGRLREEHDNAEKRE